MHYPRVYKTTCVRTPDLVKKTASSITIMTPKPSKEMSVAARYNIPTNHIY